MALTPEQQFQAYYDELVRRVTQLEAQVDEQQAALDDSRARLATAQADLDRVDAAIIAAMGGGPPFGLPLVFAPTKATDWTRLLQEGYWGSLTVSPAGVHRAYIEPNQAVKGGRMEFHELDWPGGGLPVGAEGYYEWQQLVPPASVIDGLGTAQFHGTEGSGFTGSVGITVVGGVPYHRLRIMDAGNPTPRPFGILKPGEYQRIGVHVRWSKGSDGFVRCYLDGKLGTEFKGVTAHENADKQMFRIGWYAPTVGPDGLDLYADKVQVYGRA